jgi:hypothetical protein
VFFPSLDSTDPFYLHRHVSTFDGSVPVVVAAYFLLAFFFISTAQIKFFVTDSETFKEMACNDKAVGDRTVMLSSGAVINLPKFVRAGIDDSSGR